MTDEEEAALRRELAEARDDLELIAQRVYGEARRRGWCGDYEFWARWTNRLTHQPHMLLRRPGWCEICQVEHSWGHAPQVAGA